MLNMPNCAERISVSLVASLYECHGAAKMFRKAFDDMKMDRPNVDNSVSDSSGRLKTDESSDQDNNYLYTAYVQQNWVMKSTNLRLDNKNEPQQIFCNQKWPRSLCSRDAINRFNSDYEAHHVTCLKPAEVWCDDLSCEEARCGKQGCLRCYRFLPRDYTLSANGTIIGRQSERNYDMVSFVRCSWCRVSYCSKHVCANSGKSGERTDRPIWYQCDVCEKSSCPDCVSQIFDRIPDSKGCQVITNGRICGRNVCKDCIWFVGTNHNEKSSNNIVKEQGGMLDLNRKEITDVTECCPRCLLQVEKRMNEMEDIRKSCMGFLP